MTISIKSPTSTTGAIQKNGTDVLTIDANDNVNIENNISVAGNYLSSQPSFRNFIINGDMQIAQRGTSSAGNTGNGYTTVDRFNNWITGAGTWTMSQDSDVPTGQGFSNSFKMACTTANASLGSTGRFAILQVIEGQNLQNLKWGTANAESITLSFWIKSNKTGTYTLGLNQSNSVPATWHIAKTFTIDSADTWEKKTLTISGNTSTDIRNSNEWALRVIIYCAGGSTYTSGTLATSWEAQDSANAVSSSNVNIADSTSNYINITGVQLEVGSGASDFEFLPYDVQLERCKRYYQLHGRGPVGIWSGATNIESHFIFSPEMRATPTFTVSGSTVNISNKTNGNTANCTPSVVNFGGSNKGASYAQITNANITSPSIGHLAQFRTDDWMRFDAEL